MRNSKSKIHNSTDKPRAAKFESETRSARSDNGNQKPESNREKTVGFKQSDSPQSSQKPALIFGVLPVLEALRAGNRRVEKILIADGAREKRLNEVFELAKQNGVRFEKTARQNLSKFTQEGANHQGVVAFVAAADYANAEKLFAEITSKENSLSVILDGVEDPRNLGAILRSVECAGADGVFIPERRAVGLTETVAKSAAGATEYVKVAKVSNLNRLIDELKENNIWVVGTSADAETSYADWDWRRASALVLGGEGRGLHRLTAEKCDALVKIPLLGQIESLNVSVACGVILFEAVRQRKN